MKENDLDNLDIVVIENVGNLVCPAEFDIGEDMKIAFLSTPEGADKPLKYPLLVKMSNLAIINKIDLLDHVDFDIDFCTDCIKRINPDLDILKISCKTGEGITDFIDWIKKQVTIKKEKN